MSAYIIADITLFEPEKMGRYSSLAHGAMTNHGAELLVMSNDTEALEGTWNPRRIVVLRFTDRQTAKRFYGSVDYVEAKLHRSGIAIFNSVVVEGITQSASAGELSSGKSGT